MVFLQPISSPFPSLFSFYFFFFIIIFFHYLLCFASGLTTDGLTLLAFKSAISFDPNKSLSTWVESDDNPCWWFGVSCQNGRVTELSLPNCSLKGYIPSELGLLSSLLILRLPNNNLFGPLPSQIRILVSLTDLDLSHNSLSGGIPTELGALENLNHLDLSSNIFNGSLPASIAELPRLTGVMNLSFNEISGGIPAAFGNLPVDVSLDLRGNNLSGEIPQTGSLLNQGPTAFSGNPDLCGFPLKNPCQISDSNPRVPLANPKLEPNTDVSFPSPQPSELPSAGAPSKKRSLTVPLLSGVLALALVTIFVLQWQFRRTGRSSGNKAGKEGKKEESPERREGQAGGEIFVALDEGFALELEELLRASAYVVGKSRSGIVYKVVVGRGGGAVAVRRLSEAEDGNAAVESAWKRRRDFESEAMAIGRAKHPNVVSLRAYYYAPDEKLLVYDYIPNGSLHAALHGSGPNPSPVSPLMWSARLKIIQGAARGLAFLHECSPRKYIHGSIKSSKILLDEDLHPYISGFGLARLVSTGQKSSSKLSSSHLVVSSSINSSKPLNSLLSTAASGYMAPEVRAPGNWLTQKTDVYSFGIILLEVLTGRMPGTVNDEVELESFVRTAFKEERPLSEIVDPTLHHEVYAKKQVLAVFHVALGCTEIDPELRLRMRAVSESLDRVGGPQ